MSLYLRNLDTGKIVTVEPETAEFAKLKAERTEDGRFPLYEQTGAHDADPKHSAADYEVENREKWDADIHDVTTDGVIQTGPGQLGQGEPKRADRKTAAAGAQSPPAKKS